VEEVHVRFVDLPERINRLRTAQGHDIQPGEILNPDQSITSANGRYTFVYQGDGNLVLYGPGGPLWDVTTSALRSAWRR